MGKLDRGFDQYPQLLDTDEELWGLSPAARLLYIKLRSRLMLSMRSGDRYRDDRGYYVYYTVQEAQVLLVCGKSKAQMVFRELERTGLLKRRRVGYSHPYRIYVRDLLADESSDRADEECVTDDNPVVSAESADREQLMELVRQLHDAYPEERRVHPDDMMHTVMDLGMTEGDLHLALENIELYKRSSRWTTDGGRYIPGVCRWLRNGWWRVSPKTSQPADGKSLGRRELDEDELQAIEWLFRESDDAGV